MAPVPYIRTTNGPSGHIRPIPSGVNYYATPAVWIRNPQDPGQDRAVAVADADQFVVAEVGNLGNGPADDAAENQLIVQFWAAGFGTASGFSASLGGQTGLAKPAPAVPAGSVAVPVELEWRPQGAELGGAAERHFCIRANVYDSINRAGDALADGSLVDVPAQRRHAQRNMTLVPNPTAVRAFSFQLATGNPGSKEREDFELEIGEVVGKFQASELVHLMESAWLRDVEDDRLVMRGSNSDIRVRPVSKPSARRIRLELGKRAGQLLKVSYEPSEEGWVTMRVLLDGTSDDGLVRRFDVVQRGRAGVIGATRVMTISVPDELMFPELDEDEAPTSRC